jgi:hypothetical protein
VQAHSPGLDGKQLHPPSTSWLHNRC